MGDELGCLHPHQKIRVGRELDAVDILCQSLGLPKPGMIQKQDPCPLQGAVFLQGIFLPGQIRENADGNGAFQIGVGREGTGQIEFVNIPAVSRMQSIMV